MTVIFLQSKNYFHPTPLFLNENADKMRDTNEAKMQRPEIDRYNDPRTYLRDMIRFRKATERSFSVLKACRDLRRVSPTLVSLLVKGQRQITLDRVEELSRLLGLSPNEKQYFK